MQFDRFALDEDRFKSLNTESVQGRRAVEEHGMFFDHFVKHRKDFWRFRFDEHLGLLDVVNNILFYKLLHNERLEELEGHLSGQPTLPHLELRSDDDDGTAGIVDTLTEKILAEAPLLAFQHVGQGLQWPVPCAFHRAAAARIVEERIDGLLQHAFLVEDDDVGCIELQQFFKAVVAVYDTAVEIVEVARGEAPAIELDHGSEFRRNDRNNRQNHPFRAVAGRSERLDELDAL